LPPPPPTPSATLAAISLNPTSVAGGGTVQGTATLTENAPSGGAVVSLSSGNTTVATVPASVNVPSGARAATFTVSTSPVTMAASVAISGRYGGTTQTANLTVTPSPSRLPPIVASIAPALGPAAGGTSVTITGSNFVTGAAVVLGGTNATGVTVVNSTTISATTAAHPAGRVDVTVRNNDGMTGALSNGFAYWTVTAAITGGPYQTNHTNAITIDGGTSAAAPFGVKQYLWNCGQTTPAVPENCTNQPTSPRATFRYRRLTNGETQATYTVTLILEDNQGNRSAPATTTVRVTNSY
jgi:hypothetical protein